MLKRDVVELAVRHEPPPYVPWDIALSGSACRKMAEQQGDEYVSDSVGNHFRYVASGITDIHRDNEGRLKDAFGVEWVQDAGTESYMTTGVILCEPCIGDYVFPDASESRYYEHIQARLDAAADCFRIFAIGYTLFERAWTLRGMENLMMDLVINPGFVHELLDAITEVNIRQIQYALNHEFDCVHFGDDWGHQHGLLISPEHWREFILPRLKKMFDMVKRAGLYVSVHSCGDVHLLFDDLIDAGLDIANPFQPEAMDVFDMLERYGGRLAFHGGLSTQETLPRGTVEEVETATRKLLCAGLAGGYIFAPGHGVGGEVPVENIMAMLNVLHSQPGYESG